MSEAVDHPSHYTSSTSGVECIEITRWLSFNLGNAVKYLWRCDLKGNAPQDLAKAHWYLSDELRRFLNDEATWGEIPDVNVWMQKFFQHIGTLSDRRIVVTLTDICGAVTLKKTDLIYSARSWLTPESPLS